MDIKKEIGSYFELEFKNTGELHKGVIAINLGRNALRYIIKALEIKKVHVPYYTCQTVWDALKAEACEMEFYEVDKNFLPVTDFKESDFIIYTNYFGVCSNNVEKLSQKYPNLIVDNTMSFYSKHKGIASFNSARKFFGVTDGAYVYCNKKLFGDFEQDISYERFIPCLKRIEMGSNAGYPDFVENEKKLCNENIKTMSKLTKTILSSIDYESIKRIRQQNLNFLHNELKDLNELKLVISDNDVPMKYPFMLKNDILRHKAIENKVYLAKYWGLDEKLFYETSIVPYFQEYIFPLPLDQRYNVDDMKRIVDLIRSVL